MLKKLLMTAAIALSLGAQAEVKTITDVVGREVKVDVPAKRIMLGF